VKTWNCAWLTPPLVSLKRIVVIGVGIKRRIEINEIDAGIGNSFVLRSRGEIIPEI